MKGGIASAFLICGLVVGWKIYSPNLSVNKDPDRYRLIDRMEKDGPPDFSLPDLTGKPFSLNQLKGKVVVVNFWASWCNPCAEEFPALVKMVEHFAGKLVLVAISGDSEKKDIDSFLKAFGFASRELPGLVLLWDQERKVTDAWGVGKIPETFILNKKGLLVRKVLGAESWAGPNALAYFQELVDADKLGPVQK